jgi:glucose/arabinose dehydrogenase
MTRILALSLLLPLASAAHAEILTGSQAFGDWRSDRPGVQRRITPADLPAPFATRSASSPTRQGQRPANLVPQAPPGFKVELFAQGIEGPRVLRTAPDGAVFVAETWGGRILVFPAGATGEAMQRKPDVFTTGLGSVFGIAFGPNPGKPEYLYAAVPTGVVRYPWRVGATKPIGGPEWIIRDIPGGGHGTRDIAFAPDGKTLFVSVGSLSNVAQGTGERPRDLKAFESVRLPGAAWGQEDGRAVLLAFDPDGKNRRFHATGLRNCSSLTIQPATGLPWCAVNERDGLGDDLPPDYATAVQAGGFYGWPWYYSGTFEEPRHKGARPDLRERAMTPDVLLQPHSAPLGIAFYDGAMFPSDYRGDAFVTLRGSWNRAKRTGYKVVRLRMENGKPTGVYEDFLTGFVLDDASVWGRPVGVTVMKDGALLVSEDGSNTIWRVTYSAR